MATASKNGNDGKSLKVYIEQVKGSRLVRSTVAVEYDINDAAACKRYPNVLRAFARIGFTAEANYKPNSRGITPTSPSTTTAARSRSGPMRSTAFRRMISCWPRR